jgi:hypothetical protein
VCHIVKIHRYVIPIDILPDNVLLEIFNLCLGDPSNLPIKRVNKWQRLVHVCQRWRRIIFESPRCLNLHLSCTYGTPVWKNLHFWPATLPLTLDYPLHLSPLVPGDTVNIFAALEHPSRIHRIAICAQGSLLSQVAAFMQLPFPALTYLELECTPPTARGSGDFPISGRLFGGSALRLQHLCLKNIPFRQLPTFLLSACNLVTLKLEEISEDYFVSPKALVKCLAIFNALTNLSITFEDPRHPITFLDGPPPLDSPSSLDGPSPPDDTKSQPDFPRRTILPALTMFHYSGYCEYLEDILVQIDAPQLDNCRIEYMARIRVPQLSHFINRTEGLKLCQFRRAEVTYCPATLCVQFNCSEGECRQAQLSLEIFEPAGVHFPVELVNMLDQLVDVFPNVDQLSVHGINVDPEWMEDIEDIDWLPFFRLFHAVEALHLSGGVVAYIVSALQDIDEEMVTDVFTALHLIWLDEDRDKESDKPPEPVGPIQRFLFLRQLDGLPVTVVHTEDEFFEDDSDRESI